MAEAHRQAVGRDRCVLVAVTRHSISKHTMSSWKNAVPRREYRERPQPRSRERLGLLEKHKDYAQRARNFHSKEQRILALKRRAEMRNDDEFYFGMNKTQLKVRAPAADGPMWPCEPLLMI